jgi:hypothetical protein
MLAFFCKMGFHLSGRPQKERLENFFSSQKICVCVLKKTYFFFAVFFFAAFFFTAIIYHLLSLPYSDENKLFNFYFIYKFIYDKFLFVNKKITF